MDKWDTGMPSGLVVTYPKTDLLEFGLLTQLFHKQGLKEAKAVAGKGP